MGNRKEIELIDIRHRNRISNQANLANTTTTEEYKNSNKNNQAKNKKKTIKKPKMFKKLKKFIPIALITTSAVIGGVTYMQKAPEYKENAASRILKTVKEELGADKIYNNSSKLSSNSDKIEFIVEKNGKEYVYSAYIDGSETTIRENTIKNMETINAIEIAGEAQDGNIFDAIIANRFADKIEKGEVNLTVGEKTMNEKNQDDERDDR